MFRSTLFAFIFLAAAVAIAEPPKAVITGRDGGAPPAKLIPGQIHRLDSTKSVGEKFNWKVRIKFAPSSAGRQVSNEQKAADLRADGYKVDPPADNSSDEFDLYDSRRTLVLPSLPGIYHVILVAAGDGDPDIAEYDIVIDGGIPPVPPAPPGPTPPVPPTPIPTPTPVGLSAAVAAEVAKSVKPETYADWLRLAESLEKVSTLADGGTLPTVDVFLGTSKIFEDVSLSASASAKAAWATIRATTIVPRLTLLTTVPEYSKSWKEIAAGVRTGAGAQPPPPAPPGPGPAPIPTTGLRVLILEETADRGTLPPEQAAVFTSTKVLSWLRIHAPGRWRVWDKDLVWDEKNGKVKDDCPAEFRGAVEIAVKDSKAAGNRLPWLVVSNGAAGSSKELPANEDAVVNLMEQYKP